MVNRYDRRGIPRRNLSFFHSVFDFFFGGGGGECYCFGESIIDLTDRFYFCVQLSNWFSVTSCIVRVKRSGKGELFSPIYGL